MIICLLRDGLVVSLLREALDNLDNALNKLEASVDTKIKVSGHKKGESQFELGFRSDKDVNRKVAMKLDQTIEHLEKLLNGE